MSYKNELDNDYLRYTIQFYTKNKDNIFLKKVYGITYNI